MKCSIVKELLPSYYEGLTSEETNEDIRAHLAECHDCRAFYEYKVVSAKTSEKTDSEERAVELLKKLKARIRRNRIIAAVSACVILTALILFARNYEFPLPFNPNKMQVETFRGVYVTEENEYPSECPFGGGEREILYELDMLDFETTKEVLGGEHEIVESLQFSFPGINKAAMSSANRLIQRGDEEVNVIYFCCYKTLWQSVFYGDFLPYSESLTAWGWAALSPEENERMEHKMRTTEVYYLPIRDLQDRLDGMSDEEFDAMKSQGSLIWSGMAVG